MRPAGIPKSVYVCAEENQIAVYHESVSKTETNSLLVGAALRLSSLAANGGVIEKIPKSIRQYDDFKTPRLPQSKCGKNGFNVPEMQETPR